MESMKVTPKSTYYLKKLIPAVEIDPTLQGLYAAVPEKGYKGHAFTIKFMYEKVGPQGEPIFAMIERTVDDWMKADLFRRFDDKFGRGAYTLGYFKMCDKLPDNIV